MAGAVVTIDQQHNLAAGFTLYRGRIALDDSYPTAGEVIDVAGNNHFDVLVANSEGGYVFEFTPATQKLVARRVGAIVASGNSETIAATPLAEVGSTVDLSALTEIEFFAVGA